jgi:AraC-like DNA-binding protein
MSILTSRSFEGLVTLGECSPLNAVWLGRVTRPFPLPRLGHIYLIFPRETAVTCNNVSLNPNQYTWLTQLDEPIILTGTAVAQAPCLVLLLSPGFALEMAEFLDISPELNQIIHNVPLPQGDELSYLLAEMVKACTPPLDLQTADELMLEVVGELLRLLRLRQQALAALTPRKQSTIDDLLPRLLQARQLVEARFLADLQVVDVATAVSLSEFHFARLFKAAFNESLYQFIKRLRLDEARRRLLASEVPVTELGLQVGYSSLSSFIHSFRRRFGLSPAQYRDQLQSAQE